MAGRLMLNDIVLYSSPVPYMVRSYFLDINYSFMIKKIEATKLLTKQLDEIQDLKNVDEGNKKYQEWKEQTCVIVKSIFGEKSSNYHKAYSSLFPNFFVGSIDLDYHSSYLRGLEAKERMLRGFITEVKLWNDEDINYQEDTISVIKNICNRFCQVVRQLRERHGGKPTIDVEDEYDVQYILKPLLALYFNDIRSEEWSPSYAGSASRIDFLLKQEKIAIEVKKTRKGLSAKELGEQLMIDIEKYTSHPNCDTLICFVYDPERKISNPFGIENDLNRNSGKIKVIVIITPK